MKDSVSCAPLTILQVLKISIFPHHKFAVLTLRNGDKVTGKVRPPKENERYYGLLHVELVNGEDPELAKERVHFPALTPLYPDRHIKLETESSKLSTRIMDLVAPVGFGQRGLIVAPPKAGKTMLLKEIANSITTNYPDAELNCSIN